jgi:copper chaperone
VPDLVSQQENTAKRNLNVISNKSMALKLTVPTLDSPEAAQSLKETILASEPDAKVNVDVDTKTVTVDAQASEETFKELIVAAGHKIA